MQASATFLIPARNMGRLQEQIEALNKRAKRLHCTPISLEEVGIERKESEDGLVSVFYRVQVSGEAPKVNGWTFIAVLEHLDEGNIVRGIPGMVEEGELVAYREAPPQCDHCRTLRMRKDTYLLRDEQGEVKQVGSTCLKDFTGHDDPLSIAAGAELLALASEAAEAAIDDDWGMGSGRTDILDLEMYLRWASATIRKHGYVSRSKVDEYHPTTTSAMALLEMDYTRQHPYDEKRLVPDERDSQHAKDALVWIREGDWSTANDYLYNLYQACKGSLISSRHIGLAASLFVAYDKATEHKQEGARSEWQGSVGKKGTFILTVDRVAYSEGQWGTTAIYALSDAEGNQFTWFSSKDCLEKDEMYRIVGTVKAFDTYQGIKKTVLTRCQYTSLDIRLADERS